MTVASAALYRHGQRVRTVAIDEPTFCSADKAEFVWIGWLEPSEDKLRALQKHYGLHPLAVENALKAHQHPKVDVYGDQLFVVALRQGSMIRSSLMARPPYSWESVTSSPRAMGQPDRITRFVTNSKQPRGCSRMVSFTYCTPSSTSSSMVTCRSRTPSRRMWSKWSNGRWTPSWPAPRSAVS